MVQVGSQKYVRMFKFVFINIFNSQIWLNQLLDDRHLIFYITQLKKRDTVFCMTYSVYLSCIIPYVICIRMTYHCAREIVAPPIRFRPSTVRRPSVRRSLPSKNSLRVCVSLCRAWTLREWSPRIVCISWRRRPRSSSFSSSGCQLSVVDGGIMAWRCFANFKLRRWWIETGARVRGREGFVWRVLCFWRSRLGVLWWWWWRWREKLRRKDAVGASAGEDWAAGGGEFQVV